MSGRKRKIMLLSPQLFYDLFTVGSARYFQCIEGLPEKARFVAHGYEATHDTHYLVFESDEWEEVPDGQLLPELRCVVRAFSVVPLLIRAEEMIERTRPHGMEQWLAEWRTIKDKLVTE